MPLDNPTNTPMPDFDPFAEFNTSASSILFPVGERNVGWQTRSGEYERCETHKAIIRVHPQTAKAQLLNIVGIDYKLVHNKDLFTRVETTMKEQMLPEHLHNVQVTDKVSGFGKICFRQYIFPNIKCKVGQAKLHGGTIPAIAFRVIVQNGYGGSALRMYSGAIDFYCTNGMVRGDHTATYRKHTKGLEISGLSKMIADALVSFADNGGVWDRWANTYVPREKARAYLDNLNVSPKLRDNLTTQYLREAEQRGHNLWSLYSALTYYASHGDGDFKMRSSVETTNTEAYTMLQREINVSRWVAAKEWRQLEHV